MIALIITATCTLGALTLALVVRDTALRLAGIAERGREARDRVELDEHIKRVEASVEAQGKRLEQIATQVVMGGRR